MTKIDAAKFIADMIKVHGGECPKVWQDTLAMQGLKVENGEIVSIRPEHKFKVGDTIRSKKHGNKYIETIKAVLNDAYLFTDEKVLSFEFEDKWEVIESEQSPCEQFKFDKESCETCNPNCEHKADNLHQYLYGTLTEFEQCLKSGTNIYVEQGRHMEDWDAKSDAKELLEIARKTILAEEIELAYKTRDEVQYKDGFHDGYEEGFTDAMGAEYENSL